MKASRSAAVRRGPQRPSTWPVWTFGQARLDGGGEPAPPLPHRVGADPQLAGDPLGRHSLRPAAAMRARRASRCAAVAAASIRCSLRRSSAVRTTACAFGPRPPSPMPPSTTGPFIQARGRSSTSQRNPSQISGSELLGGTPAGCAGHWQMPWHGCVLRCRVGSCSAGSRPHGAMSGTLPHLTGTGQVAAFERKSEPLARAQPRPISGWDGVKPRAPPPNAGSLGLSTREEWDAFVRLRYGSRITTKGGPPSWMVAQPCLLTGGFGPS